jgi:hypothetical protein
MPLLITRTRDPATIRVAFNATMMSTVESSDRVLNADHNTESI